MGRSRSKSPARSRSSKQKSSYRRNRSRRSRSKSPSKYSRRYSSRSRSRSLTKYGSSSKTSGSSKYQSSRRRQRSSSSSSSSYSSDSSRSHKSISRDKKLTKKVEQMTIAVEPPAPPQIVFESVNLLHDDKDKKVELDDLDNEGFVQKSFTSNKKPEDPKVEMEPVAKVKEAPPVDTLLHHELFGDDDARLEKWIRKLFNYRQKVSQGEA